MKKLGIFVMPLMVISLLASCGGGDDSSKTYTITWDLDNGTEAIKEIYQEGDVPSFKYGKPTKEQTNPLSEEEKKEGKDEYAYTFKSWDKELTPVNSDVTYKAIYSTHSLVTRISFNSGAITAGKTVEFDFTYSASENDIFVNWGDERYSTHTNATLVSYGYYHISHSYLDTIENDFSILVYGSIVSLCNLNTSNAPTSLKLSSAHKTININSFSGNTSIASIFIPMTIKTIGENAFKECANLTSVTFEEESNLKSIDNNAFYSCSNLTSIDIPKFTESIGKQAFYSCSNLTSVVIPKLTKTIGDSAFEKCSSLSSITFEKDSRLETIGEMVFTECPVTSVIIPKSVKTISFNAFFKCASLSSLIFEEVSQIETIGTMAFASCSLTTLKIPKSTKTIGQSAFTDATLLVVDLTEFIIEDSEKIPSIGYSVFPPARIVPNLKFYVANDNMLNIFTADSNWKTYASQFTTDPVPTI